jgi:hypothetical protein
MLLKITHKVLASFMKFYTDSGKSSSVTLFRDPKAAILTLMCLQKDAYAYENSLQKTAKYMCYFGGFFSASYE